MIYPWHESEWRQIAAQPQRLPHAMLFCGQRDTGKTAFARHLAQLLLCENPGADGGFCGTCPSCHLFAQNSHPDFYELAPETAEGETAARKLPQIKIDAVRGLIEHIRLTSVRGGRRVVLIRPAEAMNAQAANGLLKILEEPPENVVFLLVSHERDRLLPTIRSRCRQTVLPAPGRAAALEYVRQHHPQHAEELLAFHSGAPLFDEEAEQTALRGELLQFLAAPRLIAALDYSAAFDKHKLPLAVFLDWMQKWLLDVGLAQRNMPPRYYPVFAAQSAAVAVRTDPAALFAFGSRLNALVPYGHHTLSVRMQAESLLTEYLRFWQNK
ncbi:DNA polymerase III subunit delta' [Kingella potus]|uniref:DNA polymerase III subunit delta n=1 Tax=Kingella potus TaxID=265175 RepID=A0A377R4R1_9NEIS|nr:DNA polymerase III subunit delta' [Kingella potus]STR03224.1 DNA polymerase III subunit delta' [Kingella potus]